MAYEAFYYSGLSEQYKFETLEELVHHHWYKFLGGVDDSFRIIDTYDRQRVDIEIVKRVFNRIYNANMERYWSRNAPYEFRNGPVPNIRRRRGRKSYGYRRPRTQQERCETAFLEIDEDLQDVKFKVRVCRRDLPTLWDERGRNDYADRCWKSYRKTQYKVK